MIRIIEQISLDGVIQASGGPDEDGDYRHGGWVVPHFEPSVGQAIDAAQGENSDLLLGRRTYDCRAACLTERPPARRRNHMIQTQGESL
jgi:dihydrofolate reductase